MFDQSCGHWLLFDALCATITMTLKPKKKKGIAPFMGNLMEDNRVVALEWYVVAYNIRI